MIKTFIYSNSGNSSIRLRLVSRILPIIILCLGVMKPLYAHDDTSSMVERILPGVVTLEVELNQPIVQNNQINEEFFPSPQIEEFFRRFFGEEFFDQRQRGLKDDINSSPLFLEGGTTQQAQSPQRQMRLAYGSGFIISEDGQVITNHHVIERATKITVTLSNDNEKYEAEVIGVDPETDIAVLKIDSDKPFEFVSFGDSSLVRIGDPVVVIGNPLGVGLSVSKGVVSAKFRDLGGPYDNFLQTDASINLGNSGGPLFNSDGEVIGVNTAIRTAGLSVGSIGIGFSISSEVVTKVVDQIIAEGSVSRGYLGISIGNPEDEEFTGRIRVENVYRDSAAYRGGLLPGDIILSIDDYVAESIRDFIQTVSDNPPGSEVTLQVERGNEELTLQFELGSRPVNQTLLSQQQPISQGSPLLGIVMEEVEGADGEIEVRVVSVEADSAAARAGMSSNDIIYFVNHNKVNSVEEVQNEFTSARDSNMANLPIIIERGGVLTEIIIELEN